MQRYIEDVRTQPGRCIRERSIIERWLNTKPLDINDLSKHSSIIMYKDKWSHFGKTLLMGLDFDFLMLDVCTLSFIECAARFNTGVQSRILLGVLVAYIFDSFLIYLRGHFGRKNLSKHTLVDEAFLI